MMPGPRGNRRSKCFFFLPDLLPIYSQKKGDPMALAKRMKFSCDGLRTVAGDNAAHCCAWGFGHNGLCMSLTQIAATVASDEFNVKSFKPYKINMEFCQFIQGKAVDAGVEGLENLHHKLFKVAAVDTQQPTPTLQPHFDALKLPNTATPWEIKLAWRTLSFKHHPDKGGDSAQFYLIDTAYKMLKGDTMQPDAGDLLGPGFCATRARPAPFLSIGICSRMSPSRWVMLTFRCFSY